MVHNQNQQTVQNVYKPVQQVKDSHPIRATCFHPSGEAYVVGTNSKALKICKYPSKEQIVELTKTDDQPNDTGCICEPEISFTCLLIHRASVYCTAFNEQGNLLASGSNDQVVHIIKYNSENHAPEGNEYKLTMHNGTVRDVCFLPSGNSNSSQLLSAGGRDFEIYLTDCATMRPKHTYRGHKSTVMSLHCCPISDNTFVSGALDGAIKIWDTRCRDPIDEVRRISQSMQIMNTDGDTGRNISLDSSGHMRAQQEQDLENQPPNNTVSGPTTGQHAGPSHNGATPSYHNGTSQGVPVGAVRLDPTGRLLVSGHQDGSCMLYDIRAGRIIQSFVAHDGEIRALNFSPESHYILSASYDRKARLTDLQGQLTNPLPSVVVLEQEDKIVQTAWHPVDYNFVTTCADGSATLWTIPNFDEWCEDSLLSESF